jgi:cell wall-associated NlpC family hydrolase
MTDASRAHAADSPGGRIPRLALLAAALVCVVVGAVVLLADGGRSPAPASRSSASGASASASSAHVAPALRAAAHARRGGAAGSKAAAGGKRVSVAEVADPEESKSFPAPASVHHKAAATPSKASEQIVAAGAPSDAEVKQELAQMQAVERSAKQAQQQRLTPVPGGESIGGNGAIPIPSGVPEVVQRVIAGANEIADFPYVFGGGHASFVDNAYDCSGSVSYALAAGGLLGAPETSGELESWGAPGPGRYITVYANAGHTYMYVDGILYDTAGRSGVYASRWQVAPTDNSGYVARHWPGL